MDVPISVSQGAVHSLPAKLQSLLEPACTLSKEEKKRIDLLRNDVEKLITGYLVEPTEVVTPASTASCWMREVCELSYDIDDFVDESVYKFVPRAEESPTFGLKESTPFCLKMKRLCDKLKPRRSIIDQVFTFRARLKEAIQRHESYNLGNCSFRSQLSLPLPLLNSIDNLVLNQATFEELNQHLSLRYNSLPAHLRACMLYLTMYQKDYKVCKYDLLKQWISEDFISVVQGFDMKDLAGSCFDELVKRELVSPLDTNHNGEILSCAVHPIVHDFIRCMSIHENFVITVDHSQSDISRFEKVRRLSLDARNARDATIPVDIRLSQLRSLSFVGLFKLMPSIDQFRLLRVLILRFLADLDDMSYDLTGISKLFRLTYLSIHAYHATVELPRNMHHLEHLELLEIDAKLNAVPFDISEMPCLLYLSLPGETGLPFDVGCLTTLLDLGYYNLCRNKIENVQSLGHLINLQVLHLTCSVAQPVHLKNIMKCLCSVLGKLINLKTLTLVPVSCSAHILEANQFSFDLDSVSSPPVFLETLELLPRVFIFSAIPKWIKELSHLCILKIEVMSLSSNDINILSKLPALTTLSLYVYTAEAGRAVFVEGFLGLNYFNFVCTAPCMQFLKGTMCNVQELKLGFNADEVSQYNVVGAGFQHLTCLKEISAIIGDASAGESDRDAAKSALLAAMSKHPNSPIFNLQHADWIFSNDKEKSVPAHNEGLQHSSYHI